MLVDKAHCKSTDGGFDRSITCRKDTSISGSSIYPSKEKELSFPWSVLPNVVSLPSGCRLVTLEDGVLAGAQCWSQLLADLCLAQLRSTLVSASQ